MKILSADGQPLTLWSVSDCPTGPPHIDSVYSFLGEAINQIITPYYHTSQVRKLYPVSNVWIVNRPNTAFYQENEYILTRHMRTLGDWMFIGHRNHEIKHLYYIQPADSFPGSKSGSEIIPYYTRERILNSMDIDKATEQEMVRYWEVLKMQQVIYSYPDLVPVKAMQELLSNYRYNVEYFSGVDIEYWDTGRINDTLVFATRDRVSYEVNRHPEIPRKLTRKKDIRLLRAWSDGYWAHTGRHPEGFSISLPLFDGNYTMAIIGVYRYYNQSHTDARYNQHYHYLFLRVDGKWKRTFGFDLSDTAGSAHLYQDD